MVTRPKGKQVDASNPSSISSTLLDQLRSRRPQAWQRLVRLYGPVIYRWCRRSNLRAEDAADLAQEVLAAVMIHLPEFRRDRAGDSFSGWLATITRNKIREHYRRRQGKPDARGGSTAAASRWRKSRSRPNVRRRVFPAGRTDGGLPVAAGAGVNVRAEFETRTWDAFWRVSVAGQSPGRRCSGPGNEA